VARLKFQKLWLKCAFFGATAALIQKKMKNIVRTRVIADTEVGSVCVSGASVKCVSVDQCENVYMHINQRMCVYFHYSLTDMGERAHERTSREHPQASKGESANQVSE
jgi:hypothetical protein